MDRSDYRVTHFVRRREFAGAFFSSVPCGVAYRSPEQKRAYPSKRIKYSHEQGDVTCRRCLAIMAREVTDACHSDAR